MNLVSLLVAPAIVALSLGTGSNPAVRGVIAAVAIAIIVGAVWNSKRKSIAVGAETELPSQGGTALEHDGADNAATPA
jgi:K(+)-stimulated pyrophosphate-energized sodium pump